jgi:sugar lactone lactonase YvrE
MMKCSWKWYVLSGILLAVVAALSGLASCGQNESSDSSALLKAPVDLHLKLEPVFEDSTYQLTGVAVSKEGRLFTNYPRWSKTYQFGVVEVKPGGVKFPFPDEKTNAWEPSAHEGKNPEDIDGVNWICVQAVYVDKDNNLWVVDPASPFQKGVFAGKQKLVKINLSTNKIERVYTLIGVTDDQSYINDVRVDTRAQTAYMTNSSEGGLIIVDLQTGKSRQVLQGTHSVISSPRHNFYIDGNIVKKSGAPFHVNSDGIALTPDGQYLYYKPLTDDFLYRIRTEYLKDTSMDAGVLAAKVETVGSFAITDGMEFDKKGNLYLGDIPNSAIIRIDTGKHVQILVSDKRLIWPDSYQITDNGYLYVSCSQIQMQPPFNEGVNKRTTPYSIYRIKLPD